MSSSLPTTPVGKQQLIDMRAGAILRGHARKSERYLGCPVRLLLTFIVLIKSSLLCGWLVREYYFFDFGCSFFSTSLDDEIMKRRSLEVLRIPVYASDAPAVTYFDEGHNHRVKRIAEDFGSDSQMRFKKGRKKSQANSVPTTVVTMTNTQLLPVQGDTLRMKTIRNRVEPLSDMSEDDMLEIDIDAPPRVYISKIMTRGQPINYSHEELGATTQKPKRRKGKGRKKKKKFKAQSSIATSTTTAPTTKKRKGHRKKQKGNQTSPSTEQTKSPRHLFSSPDLPLLTTPRPHQSNFLYGVIDPKDPQFSNKGQIRGYPMHIASRKPTPSTRLSEETRLMWEMDELNYTTYASVPKTTAVTDADDENEAKKEIPVISVVQIEPPESTTHPQSTESPPKEGLYATNPASTWRTSESPPTTSTMPMKRVLLAGTGRAEQRENYEDVRAPVKEVHREKSTLERLSEQLPAGILHSSETATSRPRPIKHGFDRSLDEAIGSGLGRPQEDVSKERDHDDDGNFQFQLSTFSSSATCIARTMFDLWCVCQLMTLFPYLIGVCVAHRSLFVSHLVLDILLLVIGFVYTITMIVFSIVLYVLIGEMPKETLFEWILFALLLDAILLLYACLVVISLHCCERIVQCRLSMEAETPRTSMQAALV